ncbi:hypothetical protein IHV12_01175 [Fictibacillus sp. 7GRE50]|uniref:hypothetical protein n=1 Tax=Fictibacillus sp. 7GRE50 TaxID=2745878 RepID=UPI0018CE8D77|nr:hypothetical protein [Fictibacillus sp. 7GRE50]MBH0163502.1 hypothetical protein [Fictibacillus sp. 7GRE50]
MKYERCITFFLILKTHPFYKKKRRIRIGSSLLQPLDVVITFKKMSVRLGSKTS